MNTPEDMLEAGSQFQDEICSLVKRYGKESGLTVFQAIGALEVVKSDLIMLLNKGQNTNDT